MMMTICTRTNTKRDGDIAVVPLCVCIPVAALHYRPLVWVKSGRAALPLQLQFFIACFVSKRHKGRKRPLNSNGNAHPRHDSVPFECLRFNKTQSMSSDTVNCEATAVRTSWPRVPLSRCLWPGGTEPVWTAATFGAEDSQCRVHRVQFPQVLAPLGRGPPRGLSIQSVSKCR